MSSAKIYARVSESSLMSAPVPARYVFLVMVAIADVKGRVIGTDERICARLAVSPDEFTAALEVLTAPDENSSSKLHEGRRLVRMDEPRGFKIVNYAAYQGRKAAAENIDPSKCPTCAQALAIASIFRRRQETEWDEKEITAFKGLMRRQALLLEDLALVHRFYEWSRRQTDRDGKESGFHRRNLITFLNNYLGEVDKAKSWAAQNPKAAARALAFPQAPATDAGEPAGFRDWLKDAYPGSPNLAMPWGEMPDVVKREYREVRG